MIRAPGSQRTRVVLSDDQVAAYRADAAKQAEAAFERAIAEGRLSANSGAYNFAGNYFYMGEGRNGSAFKHRETRQYLPYAERN